MVSPRLGLAGGSGQGRSLRSRLMLHVLVPLALTWLAGTVVSVQVSSYFAQRAFDRALLDDAYAVANSVRLREEGLEFTLSSREVRALLFDQVESSYFAVRRPDGSLLAGHAGLPLPDPESAVPFRFLDLYYEGRPMRAVMLRRSQPLDFYVVMAQTTKSRTALLGSLLRYSLVPELLLLVVLAGWLRWAIRRDLAPLTQLQHELERRDAHDLTPLSVQASTRDVQHLESTLNALLARVGRGVQAQREFAGNVAHELRTPLAGIRALAEYGLAQKNPEAWREQLQRIAASQERASHLVDQLLALALADEASTQLEPVPLALDALVRDVVLRYLPRADAAGVDLGALGLDDPVHVLGHPTLIEGILNNLLDNALRYGAPPGGGQRHITVELSAAVDGGICMSVSDNGPGIAAAERERLLRRWAQGDEGEWLGEGVGLGMAIVSRYAQLLGARFDLGTAPGGAGLQARVVFASDRVVSHAP